MTWQDGFKFTGQTLFGHEISTDASIKAGGQEDGYQPLELLLFSLAGCTGVDVIMIAKKMRLEIDSLSISVKADQREESPRAFTSGHIKYAFTGNNLNPAKLERIIKLSEEKYCSASATLSGVMKISHSFTINGE